MKHAPCPGEPSVAWCSLRDHYMDLELGDYDGCNLPTDDGEAKKVTHVGVVRCPECIELLCAYPQYYNALRAQGMRTGDERDHNV